MTDLVPLPELARRIDAEHQCFEATVRQALRHARNAGDLLRQAKARLPHGQWLAWLAANCAVTPRTAQRYMLVAERWRELTAGRGPAEQLTFREAMKLL